MRNGNLLIADGQSAGTWIASRLSGEFGVVTQHVPADFEAYARIFHPAVDHEGHMRRWHEVAKTMGTIAHHEMQWQAIINPSYVENLPDKSTASEIAKWGGIDPLVGEMPLDEFDALCEIIAAVSDASSHCYFGLCIIEDWLSSFSADELRPLLNLPLDRDYIVLTGPLAAADEIVRDGFRRAVPNLVWPSDHTWLVASEVDFDSTLVGGSFELVQTIIDAPTLEAWSVEPTTSLAADADRINAASC